MNLFSRDKPRIRYKVREAGERRVTPHIPKGKKKKRSKKKRSEQIILKKIIFMLEKIGD